MILSRAIRNSAAALAIAAGVAGVGTLAARDDAGDLIRRARRDASEGRYVQAESTLAIAERMAQGEDRTEARFLRAGLVSDAAEAQRLYERILADDPRGERAGEAALELAKIHFAMGRYETARSVLQGADACRGSDEACLFEGLSANLSHDFESARAPLERVRRGRHRTWAAVALAEAEAEMGNTEVACRLYESLTRARVSPTAWYRYAECLEEAGDRDRAMAEYASLEKTFAQTPEAMRSTSKLAPPEPAPPVAFPDAIPEDKPIRGGQGYTVQFGSFSDRANAIKLAAKIKPAYPNVRIDSDLVNSREVFRVRCGYYATRDEAQEAGAEMSRHVEEQFTVMPVRPSS